VELERNLAEANTLLEEAANAGNDQVAQQQGERRNDILEELDILTEASDRVGSETGRALGARRLRADISTYTVAKGFQIRRAGKGSALTPDERAEIEALTRKVSELEAENVRVQAESDKRAQQIQQGVAERVAQVESTRARTQARSSARTVAIRNERQMLLKGLADLGYRLNDVTGVSAEGLYLIGRLAVNHIRAAAATTGEKITLDRIVKDVLAELNNPEITARDIHEALNARDPKRARRQRSEVERQVRELKTQAKLLTQIEEAEQGIFKPGRQRGAPSAIVARLRKQLAKLKMQAYNTGVHPGRLERALATIKDLQDQLAGQYRNLRRPRPEMTAELAELQNRIRGLRKELRTEDTLADLQEQLRTGELRVPERKEPTYTSPQLERNQMDLRRARKKWRAVVEQEGPLTTHRAIGEGTALARTMKATADVSAALRQALIFTFVHPIKAARIYPKAIRAFFSEHSAEQIDNAIRSHPNQLEREQGGLELTELDGSLSSREEYFQSGIAERIPVWGPVVRASNRDMTTRLNLVRAAHYDGFLDLYPNLTLDEKKAFGDWVNIASGRGNLGKAKAVANELALFFFSPRFSWSRVQTPFMLFKYWKLPRVRKEIAKEYVRFFTAGVTVLYLGHLAGFKVGLDHRSPDWGKIIIGNTRIDIWGGLQQPMRVIARIVGGITDKAGLTGKDLTEAQKDVDPLDILTQFTEFKLAPAVTLPEEFYTGKTAVGEERTPTETAVRALMPIVFEDIADAYQESGTLSAALVGAAAVHGVGVSTYDKKKKSTGRRRGRR